MGNTPYTKFMAKCFLVNRLQQSWSKYSMHLDCRSNDLFCKFMHMFSSVFCDLCG